MFELIQNLALTNPLELYTAVIATFGVAFWIIDRRSMKVALNAARGSEITSLRLKRQEIEAGVGRSLAMLQMECRAKRKTWENHNWRNGPTLGCNLHSSHEQKEILRIERAGGSLINQLRASAPKPESSEIEELEAYFAAAGRTSLEIERLASQLPDPQNLFH